jgi:cell division GTPase FtsZ
MLLFAGVCCAQGISDIITVPGLINVDFADVKAIISNAGEPAAAAAHCLNRQTCLQQQH